MRLSVQTVQFWEEKCCQPGLNIYDHPTSYAIRGGSAENLQPLINIDRERGLGVSMIFLAMNGVLAINQEYKPRSFEEVEKFKKG